jgi:hypothetical protein
MVRTMPHEEWLEVAGQLGAVLWHLQKAGLREVVEAMECARFLLEEEQSPVGAARKLAEIAEKLRQDPELVATLAQYEQGLSRHPKILIRLSQLTTQCLECPAVEGRPLASLARNFS